MKDEKDLMVHYVPTGTMVREALDEQGNPTGDEYIEGCAIVFNQEAVLWEDENEKVSEVIRPSCVTREFLSTQDVLLNLLHKREDTIARCNKGKGSLEIMLRENGVYFKAKVPNCDIGQRAATLIKNGTYTGCSFEAYSVGHKLINRSVPGKKKDFLIVHEQFDELTALTIAMKPVFKQTNVFMREIEDLTKAEKELLKKEEEEREGRHLLAMREADKARDRALAIMATECL